jgi:hypothetical protein
VLFFVLKKSSPPPKKDKKTMTRGKTTTIEGLEEGAKHEREPETESSGCNRSTRRCGSVRAGACLWRCFNEKSVQGGSEPRSLIYQLIYSQTSQTEQNRMYYTPKRAHKTELKIGLKTFLPRKIECLKN